MIEQDIQEASNKTVEYIEYLASFSNAEAVAQLRKQREKVKERPESDPGVFVDVLERHFGKALPKEELNNG